MDCLLYIWLLNIFQMKWYTENFIGLATDIKIKVEKLNFFFFNSRPEFVLSFFLNSRPDFMWSLYISTWVKTLTLVPTLIFNANQNVFIAVFEQVVNVS